MYQKIRDPNDPENTIVPKHPLLIVFNDGTVFESDSIQELICTMAGDNYLKSSEEEKCLARIKIARLEAMVALQFGITAVVTDGKNIIKNNYAVNDKEEDYQYTKDELENAAKIPVNDEMEFLRSLDEIHAVSILEKSGYNVFLEGTKPNGNNYIQIG